MCHQSSKVRISVNKGEDVDLEILKSITFGYESAKLKFTLAEQYFQRENKKNDRVNIVPQKLISSIFVHEISKSIHKIIYNNKFELKVVAVDDHDFKRISGEWLLDGCIRDNTEEFPNKILFAFESESNTSVKSFNEDFAKIIHVNSNLKLYLNGLNQKTEKGKNNYIINRLKHAKTILDKTTTDNLYLGFWPSPEQIDTGLPSFWKSFNEYSHLNGVELFKYSNRSFVKICA